MGKYWKFLTLLVDLLLGLTDDDRFCVSSTRLKFVNRTSSRLSVAIFGGSSSFVVIFAVWLVGADIDSFS